MKNTIVLALVLLSACGGSTDSNSQGAVDGGAGSGATGALSGRTGVGGATAGDSGEGGNSGAAGSSGASAQCDALEQQHQSALAQAKKCSLAATESQCEFPVDRTVYACGYFDNVNGANKDAISDLAELKDEWQSLGCPSAVPCAVGGFPAQLVTCKPSGQGGDSGTCK